ncbi:MAG: hypothetical protein M3R45_08990 [Pseudomonadota bacterium]|nr:hypothetical protein [Pseudomonadota bacterium]
MGFDLCPLHSRTPQPALQAAGAALPAAHAADAAKYLFAACVCAVLRPALQALQA